MHYFFILLYNFIKKTLNKLLKKNKNILKNTFKAKKCF